MKRQIILKALACAITTVTAAFAGNITYKCTPKKSTTFSSEQQELLLKACTDIKGAPNLSGNNLVCVADSSTKSKTKTITKLCKQFKGKASQHLT